MKPIVVFLRPHHTLAPYEMSYVRLIEDEFDLRIITTGESAIGGDPGNVIRLDWPDSFSRQGRQRSLLNGIYARALGRPYHLPGLGSALESVAHAHVALSSGARSSTDSSDTSRAGPAIVQAGEAASECSFQAARLKQRLGFRFFLTCSENQSILENHNAGQRERIHYVLSQADHAIAIPVQARDQLINAGFPSDRITVLGHGIDNTRFRPRADGVAGTDVTSLANRKPSGGGNAIVDREPIANKELIVNGDTLAKRKLTVDGNPTVHRHSGPIRVGYCGRFRAEKGLCHLIRATDGLNLDVLLAGDGPDRDALLTIAHPRVQFLPSRPYALIDSFYREIDIFVLPSVPMPGLVEQFGFVLLEAMASGIPVIASAVGGVPDVLGDAGILVPPGNESALRAAIAGLATDPERRADLGHRGVMRAQRLYRREDVAARLKRVYRQVLAAPTRQATPS